MQTIRSEDEEKRLDYFNKYHAMVALLSVEDTLNLDEALFHLATIEERSAYLDVVQFGFRAGVSFATGALRGRVEEYLEKI